MFLAVAILLLHPQIQATVSLTPEDTTVDGPAEVVLATALPTGGVDVETPVPTFTRSAESEPHIASEKTTAMALPDAPAPLEPGMAEPAPFAFIKPNERYAVSVGQLRAENRRKQMLWRGLMIASSGAATFDAWTTRHAITTTGAVELNPLLKPFAGNGSIYAAIQVTPLLLDFASKKMMYSKHPWVRRVWWVPQTASFVGSMFCGAHNLAFH